MWLQSTAIKLWNRLQASSYWQDVAWLVSGTVVAQALTFLMLPIFTRLYRPSDFAVMNLFVQIVAMATVVATVRYESFIQLPKRHSDGWRLMQLVGFLGMVFTVVLTPIAWVFRDTFARWAGESALAKWLVFVPVTAALTSMASAFQAWEQRRNRFRRSSEAEVAGKVGFAGSVLLGWWLVPGSAGLVLGSGLGAVLGKLAWLVRIDRLRLCGRVADFWRMARQLGRLAGSLTVSQALLSITGIIPMLVIAHAYGPEVLGQYALANQSIYLPTALLGTAMGNVYYQRASVRWAQGHDFSDLWRSTSKRLFLVGVPIYGIAVILLPIVFPIIFGGTWIVAGRFAGILAISSFFGFVAAPIDKGCLVVGAWWYIPLWHGARTLSNLLLAWAVLAKCWRVESYLYALTALRAVMYGVDYWAESVFAFRRPPQSAATAETAPPTQGMGEAQ